METQDDDPEMDSAQARLQAILRRALPVAEDGLDDEISRLMLHLSHDPVEGMPTHSDSAAKDRARDKGRARPAPLLGRLLRRSRTR
ncbi:hypothetical protein ACG3SL_09380 [Sphingomonas sp. CJ20]